MFRRMLLAGLCLGLTLTGLLVQHAAAGEVGRAQFTTAVVDREPVDAVTRFDPDTGRVYFFTEVLDLQGQRVVHRWEYGGDVMAEVAFSVNGPRWRIWSSKDMLPQWEGEWTVSVLAADGQVLHAQRFTYGAPFTHPVEGEAEVEPTAGEETPGGEEATTGEETSAVEEAPAVDMAPEGGSEAPAAQ
jgi:hypothetical protein